MKDLILCGNGGLLQYIRGEVSRDGTKNIRLIIDRISDIRSCNEFESADILLGVSWREIETWVKKLKKAGVKTIYRVPIFTMQYQLPIIQSGKFIPEYCTRILDIDSNLLYLETHVADTCNLKCRGCMHFSNIASKPNFPDLKEFDRDFKRLSELFSNIFIIRLMGGEPLLNRELSAYIEIARQYFPTAELRIVTNGLLILRQPDSLWQIMRKYHVSMDISPYPPTMEIIEKLTAKLDEEGIPYGTIAEKLHDFRKSLTLTPDHDPEKSVQLCQSSHCHFLRAGKIAKCPLPILIGEFNRVYGCSISSNDIYDIYEECSGTELKQKLEGYADMCKYCPDKAAFITWERTENNACKEDWIVEE